MVVGSLRIRIAISAGSNAPSVGVENGVISEHVVIGGYRYIADIDHITGFGGVSKPVAFYDVMPDIRLAGRYQVIQIEISVARAA
jgi:hypothetical protein